MYFTLTPSDRTRSSARRPRREPTLAEAALWELRDRRFGDFKFRRQAPIGTYVADFFRPALKLVVELDGGIHALREEADRRRDDWLRTAGYTVLRFPNEAMLRNPAVVFDAIREHARHRRQG